MIESSLTALRTPPPASQPWWICLLSRIRVFPELFCFRARAAADIRLLRAR